MGAKYTEAQKKATMKYIKENLSRIAINCSPEEKEAIRKEAEKRGMSLSAFVLGAVREKIKGDYHETA